MAATVVALGNPGPEYEGTRHNVGQRVAHALIAPLRAGAWQRSGHALVAAGRWRGAGVWLVKPQAFMNVSGPAVLGVLRRLGTGGSDVVLVHDDIDLPLGTVRTRVRGGHGGHNGVRSVLEALATEEIRRVKVGVGRPEAQSQVADYVLDGFAPDEGPAVEAAVAEAARRILDWLGAPGGP